MPPSLITHYPHCTGLHLNRVHRSKKSWLLFKCTHTHTHTCPNCWGTLIHLKCPASFIAAPFSEKKVSHSFFHQRADRFSFSWKPETSDRDTFVFLGRLFSEEGGEMNGKLTSGTQHLCSFKYGWQNYIFVASFSRRQTRREPFNATSLLLTEKKKKAFCVHRHSADSWRAL